jgi:hypothetical protein
MPEIRTANSMPNIPSCSTLVTLKTTDVIPVTNYCQAIKAIKNTKSNSIGIKSLSGSCDIKVKDKLGYQLYISVDEGSYRFFNDLQGISCNLIGEGSYTDCSDKEPKDIKPKDQGFDEAAEKIVDTSNSAIVSSGLDLSFGSLFQSKAKQIALIVSIIVIVVVAIILFIIIYCYCSRSKTGVAVTAANTNAQE